MEGPLFSTRAESNLYRSWGMDVIGMTNLQEAKLAREAELCYATMALVTDYDCWHNDHESVRIDEVLRILQLNAEHARAVMRAVLGDPLPGDSCLCRHALDNAVITQRDKWPEATFHKLRPLLQRFEERQESVS
jgi:5'-methylthioadenosine phosphorylase